MAKSSLTRNQDRKLPQIATRDELNRFLDRVTTLKKGLTHVEATAQREAIRSYLQGIGREQLQRLMGRAFADALKSPSQKLGTAKLPGSAQKPSRKAPKPSRRRSGKR